MIGGEVSVSFRLLVQARFASEGTELCGAIDAAVATAARTNAAPRNSKAISRLRRAARDGSVGEVLPFRLDAFDTDVSTLLLGSMASTVRDGKGSRDCEGIVFGESALVNAGFASIRKGLFVYVDSWQESIRTDPQRDISIGVRVIPSNRDAFRAKVRQLWDYSPWIAAAEGDDAVFLLMGLSRPHLDSFRSAIRDHSPSFYFHDPSADDPSRAPIYGMRVHAVEGDDSLRIEPTTAEAVIQISAAFHRNYWLEIRFRNFQVLVEIPDLSEASSEGRAWVPCSIEDGEYLFCRNDVQVGVPLELALACCQAFRWFSIPDAWSMSKNISTEMVKDGITA